MPLCCVLYKELINGITLQQISHTTFLLQSYPPPPPPPQSRKCPYAYVMHNIIAIIIKMSNIKCKFLYNVM